SIPSIGALFDEDRPLREAFPNRKREQALVGKDVSLRHSGLSADARVGSWMAPPLRIEVPAVFQLIVEGCYGTDICVTHLHLVHQGAPRFDRCTARLGLPAARTREDDVRRVAR